MAWFCSKVNNVTNINITSSISNIELNKTFGYYDVLEFQNIENEIMKRNSQLVYGFVIRQYVIPVICAFGLLGNMLTLVVLLRRIREGVEMLEKGSLIGMIGKLFLHVGSLF